MAHLLKCKGLCQALKRLSRAGVIWVRATGGYRETPMVTNYPQQLTATAERYAQGNGAIEPDGQDGQQDWSSGLRPSRPRCGAAFRGQPRHDAVHLLRARHAWLGDHRSGSASSLRRRRPASHAQAAPGSAQERVALSVKSRKSALAPQHQSATRRLSASRHVTTSAVVTYSSRLWSPAPPGPKRTDGIPAAPSTAASVQKLMPIVPPDVGPPATRRRARAVAAAHDRARARTGAAQTSASPRLELRILARQPFEDRRSPPRARPRRSPRRPSGAPSAAGSDPDRSCSSRPPLTIDACSEPVPMIGCGRTGLQVAIESLEPLQHASHSQDRVAAVARPAAVRSAPARLDVDPREAFVPDRRPAGPSAR